MNESDDLDIDDFPLCLDEIKNGRDLRIGEDRPVSLRGMAVPLKAAAGHDCLFFKEWKWYLFYLSGLYHDGGQEGKEKPYRILGNICAKIQYIEYLNSAIWII